MAIKVSREVNRSEGRLPATGVSIYAGMAIMIDGSGNFKPFNETGNYGTLAPYGIADVSNVVAPLAGSQYTAGQGYDYTGFSRGGLVGAFINGSELDLYDDTRSATSNPIGTSSASFVVGGKVYAIANSGTSSENGKMTADATTNGNANTVVGTVVSLTGTATAPTKLRVKFII